MTELKWFLIAFIALWVLWAAAGGYNNTESKYKELLHQPAPIDDWQPYSIHDKR